MAHDRRPAATTVSVADRVPAASEALVGSEVGLSSWFTKSDGEIRSSHILCCQQSFLKLALERFTIRTMANVIGSTEILLLRSVRRTAATQKTTLPVDVTATCQCSAKR